jgi:hypothetical protein
MRISASQNLFRSIFKVIYQKAHTRTYLYWGKFAAFWWNLMYFWGILGDFQAEIFRGFFDKSGVFRRFCF